MQQRVLDLFPYANGTVFLRMINSKVSHLPGDSWIQRFGVTDGLLRGTALSSNILCTAVLAMFSGFGASGVLISSFLHLLIAGILEIPTGILGDKIGWGRTLSIALFLKIFVTVTFFLAAFASISLEFYPWVWKLIAIESLIDAVANSLMSGSYESAYLRVYAAKTHSLDKQNKKALLLESYKYGIHFRLGIPLLLVGFVALGSLFFPSAFYQDSKYLLWACLIILLVLRLLVISKVRRDFKIASLDLNTNAFINPVSSSQSNEAKKSKLDGARFHIKETIGSAKVNTWALLSLGCANLFLMLSVMYLPGASMKTLGTQFSSFSSSWASSAVLGLVIQIGNALMSWKLLPRLSNEIGLQRVIRFFPIGILFMSVGFVILPFSLSSNQLLHFVLFIVYIPTMLVASAALQKALISIVLPNIPARIHATWISLGSSIGYLLYGSISGVILYFGGTDSRPEMFVAIAGLSLFLATRCLRI